MLGHWVIYLSRAGTSPPVLTCLDLTRALLALGVRDYSCTIACVIGMGCVTAVLKTTTSSVTRTAAPLAFRIDGCCIWLVVDRHIRSTFSHRRLSCTALRHMVAGMAPSHTKKTLPHTRCVLPMQPLTAHAHYLLSTT